LGFSASGNESIKSETQENSYKNYAKERRITWIHGSGEHSASDCPCLSSFFSMVRHVGMADYSHRPIVLRIAQT
jgi:hypothetical protein